MKTNYLSSLDINELNLYTLQLANMERIEQNDAVYIFDEVGAGKTISAGLCVIQLLFEGESVGQFKNILVITAPSVTEQFKNKFNDILKLKVGVQGEFNGIFYQIDIINYDYRNIAKKVNENHYDFIIVDEAHEFINDTTRRYEELIKLKAKKMMFMSATPIKYSMKDLKAYPMIASQIMNIDQQKLEDELLHSCKEKKKLIEGFDTSLPVTRYFKETVRNIEKTESSNEFADKEPQRLVPELWEYENEEGKEVYLAKKINENSKNGNRFVIFVRYKADIEKIKTAIEQEGFIPFSNNETVMIDKTYSIITGDHSERKELLKQFSSIQPNMLLPAILIMTYQISEQGIDLPAFNYTINYHIPASPSQLEQRFGRIDRLNSIHSELHTCFLLKKSGYLDKDTANFFDAVYTYINEFLPLLPSKNCLITYDILNRIESHSESIVMYYEKLLNLLNDNIDEIYNFFISNEISFEIIDSKFHNLLEFFKGRNVEFNEDMGKFQANFAKRIQTSINQAKTSQERIQWWKDNIDRLSNDVFFVELDKDEKMDWSKRYHIERINPKSAAKTIISLDEFIRASNSLKEPIALMRRWNKYKPEIEEYFETLFHNNDFDRIFPASKHYHTNDEIPGCAELEDKLDSLVYSLPIFRMFLEYKRIIHGFAFTDNNFFYQRYDFNPFWASWVYIKRSNKQLGISEAFFNVFDEKNLYWIEENNFHVSSSIWLKLFYYFSRKEEFSFGKFKAIYSPIYKYTSLLTSMSEGHYKNEFYKLSYLNSVNRILDEDKLRLESQNVSPTDDSFALNSKLRKYYEADKENIAWEYSLFHHFRYPLSQGKGGQQRWKTYDAIAIKGRIRSGTHYDNEITKEMIMDL
jgi:DNA or RNA helicases of superfamily II